MVQRASVGGAHTSSLGFRGKSSQTSFVVKPGLRNWCILRLTVNPSVQFTKLPFQYDIKEPCQLTEKQYMLPLSPWAMMLFQQAHFSSLPSNCSWLIKQYIDLTIPQCWSVEALPFSVYSSIQLHSFFRFRGQVMGTAVWAGTSRLSSPQTLPPVSQGNHLEGIGYKCQSRLLPTIPWGDRAPQPTTERSVPPPLGRKLISAACIAHLVLLVMSQTSWP